MGKSCPHPLHRVSAARSPDRSATGRLPHSSRAGPRRDGDRVRSRTVVTRPPRRRESAAVRRASRQAATGTLQERSPCRRVAQAPPHRECACGRVRTRRPFLRDGADPGPQPGRRDRRRSVSQPRRRPSQVRRSPPSPRRPRPKLTRSPACPRSIPPTAAGSTSRSPVWAPRQPRRSNSPTSRESFTATSNRPT